MCHRLCLPKGVSLLALAGWLPFERQSIHLVLNSLYECDKVGSKTPPNRLQVCSMGARCILLLLITCRSFEVVGAWPSPVLEVKCTLPLASDLEPLSPCSSFFDMAAFQTTLLL